MIRKMISVLMSVLLGLTMMTSVAFAANNTCIPKGDSDIVPEYEPLSEQFEEMLNNCSTKAQREIILAKAYKMGLTTKDLASERLSSRDKAILDGRITIQRSTAPNRKILINKYQTKSINTQMPDYCLWPTIYKQQTKTYCSAATIYTVGKYIGATPYSQKEIMDYWNSLYYDDDDENKKQVYPDLPMIRNYLNNTLTNKPTDYVPYARYDYADQSDFNDKLADNVTNYQPIILHLKSVSGWPYTTDGHFCICNGLLTWEDNKYFIGDTYYFKQYVSTATSDNGELKVSWSILDDAIRSKQWDHGYILS